MINRAIRPSFADDIPASPTRSREAHSLLEDTVISRCEKLRRVLELEEWITGTRDIPMLTSACRRWQEERAQLLAELHL
jgi:hypothetical protein